MNSDRTKLLIMLAGVLALVALVVGVYLVRGRSAGLPAPGSDAYEEVTRSFYRGLATLQVGLLEDARREFRRTTDLVPAEPAAWANLGLTEIRLAQLDSAVTLLEQAASLAPMSSEVALLQGQVNAAGGRLDQAIVHLRRAVELDPGNLRARFTLAQEIERAGTPNADAEAQRLLESLLEQQPDNLAVLLERTRLSAKRGDVALLQDSVQRLGTYAPDWPAIAVEQYRMLQTATQAGNVAEAARALAFLRNVLAPVPAFRESIVAVRTPSELIGEPFERFIALPSPSATPSPLDEALTFSSESFGTDRSGPWTTLLATSLNGTDGPAVFAADGQELRRIDVNAEPVVTAGAVSPSAGPSALVGIDWNHDFNIDLVSVGRGGVRLFLQMDGGRFVDSTAAAGGNTPAITSDLVGAWAADVEMDGDLDLVVGVTGAAPVVLRNNGDGTWRPLQPFAGVTDLRGFGWGDLDRDGDPDAALLDAQGDLHLFRNRQAGDFRRIESAPTARGVIAITIGDANADGVLDVVTLGANGSAQRISANQNNWEQRPLASWPEWSGNASPGSFRVFLADLDNNGTLDLVGSGPQGSRVWLGDERNEFHPLASVVESEIFSVADLDKNGQLDLIGLSAGVPVRMMGRGTKGYHWQVIRPRAQPTAGDQRINTFGIGGDIEIRAGLLTQKQTIATTPVHFGLGARTSIDVARIVWPNGVVQAEFDRTADQVIVADQRLKGSCPWVFTYDGSGMRFVTDFLWRSPLGLRINAQDTAGVTQTEDWVKIRGDQLAPKNGAYDVRITAELWETHFIDHLSLLVVDHPEDVDVFVDERFSATSPPTLAVHATAPPRAVTRAWDQDGLDVTELVTQQDGRYLATFEREGYQGIAKDHFVELEISEEISRDHPLWLVARGWVYPTDSSINVAMGQGRRVQPRGLSLEAQDDEGEWVAVPGDLGFPAGKNKTILIDLRSVTRAGVAHPRRLRLRTNLEVYWDSLALATGVDSSVLRTTRLQAAESELRYRGFSVTNHERRDVPELPFYDTIATVGQPWRDLVGYYTRFGDVRELLTDMDDRYVIMNAGDELQALFPAASPPEAGWSRDFVLIGDGWEKDGDYNTSFSKTVEPLPSHDQPNYDRAADAVSLHTDPIYRRHAKDWERYHTRYVAPDGYLRGLR